MDIRLQSLLDTAPLHIKGADGVPLYDNGKPVRIIFHSPGTERYSEVEARQTARALKRRDDNDGKPAVPTPDEARIETAEDLATLTESFEHISYGDLTGPELFKAVYADRKLGFIAKQGAKFVNDSGNFSAGSATG